MPENTICVIWIDWYAYHVARFRALAEHPRLEGKVVGIELVGGAGVHRRLVFRSLNRGSLPIETLMPDANWHSASPRAQVAEVWRRLNQLAPRTVLVPGYYTAAGIAAAVWAKTHRRFSVLMTESSSQDHERVWWKELAKRILLRLLFDGAITGGRRHVAYLKELGLNRPIAHCYDVVDNQFYINGVQEAASQGRPTGWPKEYFLYVGRLASEKNLPMLLRSFAAYRRSGGTWSLVLVGDGPDRAELEALAAREGIADEVRFEGQRATEAILPYYAFAGCFVLPSLREPWGLVVNEAMAAGLPAIVSDRCGCVDDLIVPGSNGYHFDPTRESELTEALLRIARLTPGERAQMGLRSREQVSHYSLQRWAEEVVQLVS